MKNILSLILFFYYSFGFSQNSIDTLPINQFQWIISHNSYRIGPTPKYANRMNKFPYKAFKQWDYYHTDLTTQLDSFNLKGLEIDLYHDPKGGRYYKRKTNVFFGGKQESYIQDLKEPGLKVFHFTGMDYRTYNYTFKSVLEEVLIFSKNNPNHFPLFIMIELKEKSVGNVFPFMLFGHKKALSFDKEALLNVDNEIKEVFAEDMNKLFIPDSLRENGKGLAQTLQEKGWPTLGELRGKIIFFGHAKEKTKELYLNLSKKENSLESRMMFLYLNTTHAEGAFVQVDNPNDTTIIKDALSKNLIVRTRSDVPVYEAQTGDYTRFNQAKKSGAQIISTDFYKPDYRANVSDEWSDFHVIFDGDTTVRLNPYYHD